MRQFSHKCTSAKEGVRIMYSYSVFLVSLLFFAVKNRGICLPNYGAYILQFLFDYLTQTKNHTHKYGWRAMIANTIATQYRYENPWAQLLIKFSLTVWMIRYWYWATIESYYAVIYHIFRWDGWMVMIHTQWHILYTYTNMTPTSFLLSNFMPYMKVCW